MLEMALAMLLLSLLIGMVFAIAHTSLSLGNGIVTKQRDEMLRQAFFEFVGKRFSSLPGNARLDLRVQDSGTRYISDLTLQNVPMSFTWGGQEKVAKAVKLVTVPRRSGYIDIVLRYYEDEVLEETGSQPKLTQEEPFAEIVLLEDVAYFEWRVLDGNTLEWSNDWVQVSRLPLQLELKVAFGADPTEMRQIFWITPKVDPTSMMQQLATGGGQGQPGQTGAGNINVTPGVGGGSIQVTPPKPKGGKP